MAAKRAERVTLDTERFSQSWLEYQRHCEGASKPLRLSEFIAALSTALGLPVEKIKDTSVRSKCYALNKRARAMGLKPLQVPTTGGQRGSGLPEVNWPKVFSGWEPTE
jgi:hypothetical protein